MSKIHECLKPLRTIGLLLTCLVLCLLANITPAEAQQRKTYTLSRPTHHAEWELVVGSQPRQEYLREKCNIEHCQDTECLASRNVASGTRRPKEQKPRQVATQAMNEYKFIKIGPCNFYLTPWEAQPLLVGASHMWQKDGWVILETNVRPSFAPATEQTSSCFRQTYEFLHLPGVTGLVRMVTDENREVLILNQNEPMYKMTAAKKIRMQEFLQTTSLAVKVHNLIVNMELPPNPIGVPLNSDSTIVIDRRIVVPMFGDIAIIYAQWDGDWGGRTFVREEADGEKSFYASVHNAAKKLKPIKR